MGSFRARALDDTAGHVGIESEPSGRGDRHPRNPDHVDRVADGGELRAPAVRRLTQVAPCFAQISEEPPRTLVLIDEIQREGNGEQREQHSATASWQRCLPSSGPAGGWGGTSVNLGAGKIAAKRRNGEPMGQPPDMTMGL
jgi:hypothetical protein